MTQESASSVSQHLSRSPKTGAHQHGPGSLEATVPGTWTTPVEGRLSSAFGDRPDPFTGMNRLHRGIDIAAPSGTPIRAVQAGTVVFSGHLGGYGNTIILEHSDGYRTLYGHASRNLVQEGDLISAEQIIGEVGDSGRSAGTHLRFELRKGGEQIDPQRFFVSSKNPAGD